MSDDERLPFDTDAWSAYLTSELERPVRVRFGRARRQVIIARAAPPDGHALDVRLNRLFAEAPADVREATAHWLRSGRRARKACRLLDAWIAELEERFRAEPARRTRIRSAGRWHDLAGIRDELFADDLAGELPPERRPGITWGRRGRARRTVQLGSYDPEEHLVRAHPVLDQAPVPRFFIRYVLYHELLHAVLPEERVGGRVVHHGPVFVRRERAYRDYDRAIAWQERNLAALIRSARTGEELRPAREPVPLLRAVQRLLFPT